MTARIPEARLWHAVLAHALHDAALGRDAGWIGSTDFHLVCAFGGAGPRGGGRALRPGDLPRDHAPGPARDRALALGRDRLGIPEILGQRIEEPAKLAHAPCLPCWCWASVAEIAANSQQDSRAAWRCILLPQTLPLSEFLAHPLRGYFLVTWFSWVFWYRLPGSNGRPLDPQSSALTY